MHAPGPRVSIAIVSYNSGATLPRCLAALAAQTHTDFQVILIDNASHERPASLLTDLPFAITYREMPQNLGFAGAMNEALRLCETPLFAALNPDAFPAADWLATLLAASQRHPGVTAFGSLQTKADNPSRIDGFGDHYLVWGQAWRGETLPRISPGDLAYTFGVCAAAALYRTDALRRIGGYDDRFFCFYEDVDVCFRLRLRGEQCAVVPTAVVAHVGGASFQELSDFAAYLIARNQWWVLVKNMPWPLLVVALPGFWLLQLIAAVKYTGSSRMKGLGAGLRGTWPMVRSRRQIQKTRSIGAFEMARWFSWNPLSFARKISLTRAAPGTPRPD